MGDISTWSLVAAENGTRGSPPDYWPEGQAPSTVNDCAREMMRAIKKQFQDAAWVNVGDTVSQVSTSKFRVSSSTSTAVSYYGVGKRLRLNDATTLYATVTEASISATSTNITVALDSGSLSASLTAVAFSIITPTSSPISGSTSIIYAADAGANDTYVITPSPAVSSYTAGLMLNFKANTANTGAATLNVSGLGAQTIVKPFGQTLEDGDIAAGQVVTVVYDGTNFVMQSQSQRVLYQNQKQIFAVDSVGSDSYAVTLAPAITAYNAGLVVNFQAGTANTGAATLNVNGLGAKTIKKKYNSDLETGDILANQIITVIYDGTNFQLASPSSSAVGVSGSWTKILSQAASASATIDFTGLSSSYLQYKIELIDIVPGTDADSFYFRVGTGGTPTYQASNYAYSSYGYSAGGSGVQQDSNTGVNQIILNNTGAGLRLGSAAGESYNGTIIIYNPSQASYNHMISFTCEYSANDGSNYVALNGGGVWVTTTAVTAARLLMSSGTIASGTLVLYGLT